MVAGLLTDKFYQLTNVPELGNLRVRNIDARSLMNLNDDAVKVEGINFCLISHGPRVIQPIKFDLRRYLVEDLFE